MAKLTTLTATIALATLAACATTETDNMAASAAASEATANGQESSEGRRDWREGQRRGGGGHSRRNFFETYDKNEDGRIPEAEFRSVRDEGFARRDANGDGTVSPDEYVGEYEKRLDQQLAEQRDRALKQGYVRFKALDSDGDGKMTREEFAASGKRMFSRLDDDDNGVVDDKDTAQRY
ncbi:MAG: hypothetical protein AAGA97_03120 [Pseudomonadota bacterium]